MAFKPKHVKQLKQFLFRNLFNALNLRLSNPMMNFNVLHQNIGVITNYDCFMLRLDQNAQSNLISI